MFAFYRFLLGYFLLVLTVVSLFSLSLVFTATAAQRNIAQLVPGSGGLISLSSVLAADQQVQAIENEIAPLRGRLVALKLQLASEDAEPAPTPPGEEAATPSRRKELAETITEVEGNIAMADAAIATVTRDLGGPDYQRVKAEIRAIMASSPFGLGAAIAEMHPQFLSLLLALQMGGLGALLLVVRDYLRGPFSRENEITFASAVGRLVGGLGAAICLVTLAQSAVGALFTSIRVEGDKGLLDSFTIAAIGLIGGFMGDGLAEGIQSRSLGFLKRAPQNNA